MSVDADSKVWFLDARMPEAIVVIGRTQMRTCHDTVMRHVGCAIRCVSVGLSDAASGVTVEEKSWFSDSTDAAALAEEVVHHILRSTGGRSDLEASLLLCEHPDR
jgi:hypothetical protein